MRPLLRFLSLLWPAAPLAWLLRAAPAPGSPLANGDLLLMLRAGWGLWSVVYWLSALPDWWHGVSIPATSGRAAGRATLALIAAAILFALWLAATRR